MKNNSSARKKARRHLLIYILGYALLIFISNRIASNCSTVLIKVILEPIASNVPFAFLAMCAYTIDVLVNLGLPLVAILLFFRTAVPRQYFPSENKMQWLKNCLLFVAPAELLRFVVCLSSLGVLTGTGYFSLIPTIIFEGTYMIWSERYVPIRQLARYIPEDFLAYTLCYLIYSAVHLILVALIYRRFWMQGKRDFEELVVYD